MQARPGLPIAHAAQSDPAHPQTGSPQTYVLHLLNLGDADEADGLLVIKSDDQCQSLLPATVVATGLRLRVSPNDTVTGLQ